MPKHSRTHVLCRLHLTAVILLLMKLYLTIIIIISLSEYVNEISYIVRQIPIEVCFTSSLSEILKGNKLWIMLDIELRK